MYKNIFYSNGFGYSWKTQSVNNEKRFISLFLQRLKDQYLQRWFEKIYLSSKLTTYRGFKTTYDHEFYLNFIINRKYRRTIAQFRVSAHDLEIERGWYSGVPRNDSICRLCRRTIEDEFHFVLICITYKDLRQKHLPNYCQLTSLYKFNKLMNVTDKTTLMNLVLYMYHANERRSRYLSFAEKNSSLHNWDLSCMHQYITCKFLFFTVYCHWPVAQSY